jgi:hypothetical protein
MVYLGELVDVRYKAISGSLGYVSLGIGVVIGILAVVVVVLFVPAGNAYAALRRAALRHHTCCCLCIHAAFYDRLLLLLLCCTMKHAHHSHRLLRHFSLRMCRCPAGMGLAPAIPVCYCHTHCCSYSAVQHARERGVCNIKGGD